MKLIFLDPNHNHVNSYYKVDPSNTEKNGSEIVEAICVGDDNVKEVAKFINCQGKCFVDEEQGVVIFRKNGVKIAPYIGLWGEKIGTMIVKHPTISPDDIPYCELMSTMEFNKNYVGATTIITDDDGRLESVQPPTQIDGIGKPITLSSAGLTEALKFVSADDSQIICAIIMDTIRLNEIHTNTVITEKSTVLVRVR